VQDREAHQVDGQADEGDHEHGTGVDLRRVPDPPDRLHEHESGHRDEQQPVGHRGQDLQALPAEGAPAGRW